MLKDNLKLHIENIGTNIISDKKDLNIAVSQINNYLLSEVNKQAPVIKKKVRITKHIIRSPDIQEGRRIKRRAENKYKKTKSNSDKIQLQLARKNLAKIVEKSRTQLFIDKFEKHRNDAKQTYKIINQLLNKNNEKIFPSHSSEKELADSFTNFYKQKILKIRNNFNVADDNTFINNINIIPFEKFDTVNRQDIIDIINKLENKQSPLDPLPCWLFKACKDEIVPALHKIINSSLENGYFPDNLKTAIITPIIKSRNLDPDQLNNYRPISNLTIISKILEKCVLKQLMNHLDCNELVCKTQSAYRLAHSTETALIKIYEDTLHYISPTTYVLLILLDFSAAFDTIDHSILIKRLNNNYGIKNTVLKWFTNYLNDRTYKVKVNTTLSNSANLSFGVPQGSILGPVLFSLYIKEINEIAISHNLNIHFYADDIQLYMKCNKDTDFTNVIKCLEAINMNI